MQQRTVYLAPEGFERELAQELKSAFGAGVRALDDGGRLFLVEDSARTVAWAQHVWFDVEELEVASIGEAAKALRSRGAKWALHSTHLHRRAQLIQAQLPKLTNPPLEFLGPLPKIAPGAWTLLDTGKLLAAPRTNSLFPHGEISFEENKKAPPSRAYLKLWELFTVHGVRPEPGSSCLDLGSSPGGWTWVLQSCGARVKSVDKAPLDAKIARLPGVESIKHDAFTLKPEAVGPVDWLFSDIICEPRRLFDLVETWRASGLVKNFVCTIKFKGATDHATTKAFLSIPNARVLHLFHNKHELTWVLIDSK